jgi:hypothetical protein
MSLGAGVLLLAGEARAHQVGLSRGVYVPRGAEVSAELTFARGELRGLVPEIDGDGDGALGDAELAAAGPTLQAKVVSGFELLADGRPCAAAEARAMLVEEDGARVATRYTCPARPTALTLRVPLLPSLAFGHRHLGQFVLPGAPEGETLADVVLHRASPEATVQLPAGGEAPADAPSWPVAAYFRLGVEHILIGVDHLVFLLGLVIVGGRLRSLVAVVTAFTLGHSLSLALATLGVWSPGPAIVEPAIALSIAYVGVENFFVEDAAGRWRITLPFGFIHGFGFAGVLADLGLPPDAVGLALLLFNLGVEAGQLLVLAVILGLLLAVGWRAAPGQRPPGARVLSAAIVAAGVFWFIERVFLAE